MKIELPGLPYEVTALEPYISSKTLNSHHRDHHQSYVAKLSNLIPGTRFANADLSTIITKADGAILYNATQIWNHNFYFSSINKRKEYKLDGLFVDAVKRKYGSLNGFREAIMKSAASIFGSAWLWLIVNENSELELVQEVDAESPLRKGMKPVLAIDLCEHAYCIDYPNRRNDYINSFLKLLDWGMIEKRYCQCLAKKTAKKVHAYAV